MTGERILPAGRIKRIHVNMHNIRANKDGGNRAVLAVRLSNEVVYGHNVSIRGDSELVYKPEKPLSCGARCWIETTAEVVVTVSEQA